MYSMMHIRFYWHWQSPSIFELISSVSQPLITEDQDRSFYVTNGNNCQPIGGGTRGARRAMAPPPDFIGDAVGPLR